MSMFSLGLTGSSDLNNAILEYNVQDDRKLCQFARPNGTCFMGAHCNLEHPIKKICEAIFILFNK